MPTTFKDAEATVRAFLHADIIAAWGVKKIHDSPPELETVAGDLPVAFITLADPEPNEEYSSIQTTAVNLVYTITLRAKKPAPAPGVTLHSVKSEKANILREIITTLWHYHGYNREWRGESYTDPMAEEGATENWYTVSIDFVVIVLTDSV